MGLGKNDENHYSPSFKFKQNVENSSKTWHQTGANLIRLRLRLRLRVSLRGSQPSLNLYLKNRMRVRARANTLAIVIPE